MRTLRLDYHIGHRIMFKLQVTILKKPWITNINRVEGFFKSWIQNNRITGIEVIKEEWWENNVGDYYLRGKKNSYCDYNISDHVRSDIQKIFSSLETLISEEEDKKKSIEYYFKYNPKFIKEVQKNTFKINDDGFSGYGDDEFFPTYEPRGSEDYSGDWRDTISPDEWNDYYWNTDQTISIIEVVANQNLVYFVNSSDGYNTCTDYVTLTVYLPTDPGLEDTIMSCNNSSIGIEFQFNNGRNPFYHNRMMSPYNNHFSNNLFGY